MGWVVTTNLLGCSLKHPSNLSEALYDHWGTFGEGP
jgi:hypothetical protein